MSSSDYKTEPTLRLFTTQFIGISTTSEKLLSGMMSSTATIGMVGILLLTTVGLGQADNCQSATAQQQIRQNILNGVDGNQIVFMSGGLVSMQAETRDSICTTLTNIHNERNKGFLGETEVTLSECTTALASPPPQEYTTASQLNKWTGRYCGTQYQIGSTQSVDNTEFQTPASGSPFRQQVVYSSRANPCCSPFNAIGQKNVSQ